MIDSLTYIDQPYINIEQGSDEWKQARLGHVTASNIAEVMSKGKGNAEAVGRYKYKVRLVAERHNDRRRVLRKRGHAVGH
jgi:hypothetical protein